MSGKIKMADRNAAFPQRLSKTAYLWGKYAFFISACLTFFAMAFFREVYKPLSVAAILGATYLILDWKRAGYPAIPYATLLPFVFAIYIAIFPGRGPSPDIHIASICLQMYILGLGLGALFPQKIYLPTLCLMAGISILFIYWLFASPPSFIFGGTRLQLLFNHPNVLGLMASWCLAHTFCTWHLMPRTILPFVALGVICLVAAIFFTDGRSTYLSILLAIAGSCFIMPKEEFCKILIIGVFFWVAGYAILLTTGYGRPVPVVAEVLQKKNIGNRMVFWKAALDGFYSAPIKGMGHESYGTYLDDYIHKNFKTVKERSRYAHNMYLDVLYSWGIVGAIILLAICIPPLLEARRSQDYFFAISLLLMLGHGIFDTSLHMKAGLMVLFVPLGIQRGKTWLSCKALCEK